MQDELAPLTHHSVVAHVLPPGGILVGLLSVLGLLPAIFGTMAAFGAFAFYMMQIYESPSCQKWRLKRRERRYAMKVAKLQYKQSLIISKLKDYGVLMHVQTTVEQSASATLGQQTTTIHTTDTNKTD